MHTPLTLRSLTLAGVAVLSAVLSGAASARAQAPAFVNVVDTRTNAPGPAGTGQFNSFGSAAVSGGNVAYIAGYTAVGGAGAVGVYVGAAAGSTSPTLITDSTQGSFNAFNDPALSGSVVAFNGNSTPQNNDGIYSALAGGGTAPYKQADVNTPVPGEPAGSYFNGGFGPVVAASGSHLAFTGNAEGTVSEPGTSTGVYSATAGSTGLNTVADRHTALPGGQAGNFQSFGGVSVEGGTVAFGGSYASRNASGSGIYTGNFAGGGLHEVAGTDTAVPGGGGNFTDLGSPSLSRGSVAFVGFYNSFNSSGVYVASNGGVVLSKIADAGTPVPGHAGQTFAGFVTASLSGSILAFSGYYGSNLDISICVASGGALNTVISDGDALFGSTVTYLRLGCNGLDGGELAFDYTLANGVSGIASLDVSAYESAVPEPGTWLGGGLLALGGAGLAWRHRRRAAGW